MAIKGNGYILSVWETDAYKPVACLTSWDQAFTANIIEANTQCGRERGTGTQDETASFEAVAIDTTSASPAGDSAKASYDKLIALARAGNAIDLKLDTAITDEPAEYVKAIISDLSKSVPVDEYITFSGTMTFTGAVSNTDPNA